MKQSYSINNINNIKKTIIWFIVIMLLSNLSCIFTSIYIGNAVRTVAVIIAYVIFLKIEKSENCEDINYKYAIKLTVIILAIMIAAYGIEYIIVNNNGEIEKFINNEGSYSIMQCAFLAVSAAVCEEIAFRAVPIRCLIFDASGKYNEWNVIIITATFFSLYHIVNAFQSQNVNIVYTILQMLSAFINGIIYGFIYSRCRTIIPTIVLHFTSNFITYIILCT